MRASFAIGGLLALSALAIAAPAAAGEPVLLPDITPGSTTDFAVAYMLQERVELEIERAGHIVLTSEAARPVVGDALDQCADVAGCPYAALQQLPANIAVVIRISRAEANIQAQVSTFDRGSTGALETRHYLIEPGAEDAFAREVSTLVGDTLSLRSPATADQVREAVRLIEGSEAAATAAVVPAVAPEPAPAPTPTQPTEPQPRDLTDLTFEERLDGTGVPKRFFAGSKNAYMKSNTDPRDWVFKSRTHAGRLVLEVRAGYSFGDEDRVADVRVVVDDNNQNVSEWLQEGPVYSPRVRAGLYLGYAPVTWFDFGVVVGLQYGQKTLSTGWRREDETTMRAGTADPVAALMIDLQGRARFYPVALGIAKPFVFVGGDARFFDSFHIIDPTDPPIDYPDPPGGTIPGVSGGGGLMIDAGPIVGFFAEGSFTYWIGLRSKAAELGTKPADAPPPPEGRGYSAGIIGGVQFRL